MLGNSLLGNRQLGESEIEALAPLYFTTTDTVTKTDRFSITIMATFLEMIARSEQKSAVVIASFTDTVTKSERQSALINGLPVSLLWRHVPKIISTLWHKIRKP